MACKQRAAKEFGGNIVRLSSKLEETGRLQYFYHCPSSKLPIRDVRDVKKKKKTEPHIEIGAENYINCCLQKNIISFLKNGEKYLFLVTRCKNTYLSDYNGKCFIIGYITKKEHFKEKCKSCNGHFVVKGYTKIFSFKDAYRLKINNFRHIDRKWSKQKIKEVLGHFKGRRNILDECIREIKRLDEKNNTCKTSQGGSCQFKKSECLRWNPK